MPARYAYSLNGENYTGTFSTREEALRAGLEDARESMLQPQSVFVGRRVDPDPHASGHARTVLREMAWQAHDEVGGPAAQYLNQLTDDQIRELDRDLEKVILEWQRRNELLPKFFRVESTSEHPVPQISFPSQQAQSSQPEVSQSMSSPNNN